MVSCEFKKKKGPLLLVLSSFRGATVDLSTAMAVDADSQRCGVPTGFPFQSAHPDKAPFPPPPAGRADLKAVTSSESGKAEASTS